MYTKKEINKNDRKNGFYLFFNAKLVNYNFIYFLSKSMINMGNFFFQYYLWKFVDFLITSTSTDGYMCLSSNVRSACATKKVG